VAALAAKVARPETDDPVVLPGSPSRPERSRERKLLRWTTRVERLGGVALVVVVLLPLAAAAYPLLRALDETHRTMGDTALLELAVRRLG
jgi:hypothetical protein